MMEGYFIPTKSDDQYIAGLRTICEMIDEWPCRPMGGGCSPVKERAKAVWLMPDGNLLPIFHHCGDQPKYDDQGRDNEFLSDTALCVGYSEHEFKEAKRIIAKERAKC